MDLLTVKRTAELLLRLSGEKEMVAVLPMRVQKVPFSSLPESVGRFPRCAPEAVGIPSGYLRAFLLRAAAESENNLHALTVLRHGKVILECSFPPYDRAIWHVTHSLCKTITALAIGILIDKGKLNADDRIVDLLAEKASPVARLRHRNLTVRHLLSMTSGVPFNEVATATQRDWVRGFLDTAPQSEPGSEFQYNSLNTYMLSAIVCAKTGTSLSDFLRTHLFEPMGIRRFHWETCPLGIEKGGWGLYLLQEDMAKLGQLILSGGRWQGKQLVSEAFLREMCRKQSEPSREMSDYGYGWQCWLWARPNSMLFSGLFGQNILVLPDLDMVIVSTAGGNRMFGKSAFLSLCETYFGGNTAFSERLKSNPHEERRLRRAVQVIESATCRGKPAEKGLAAWLESYRERKFREEQNAQLDGKRYAVESGTARLLPVFVQLLENNYTAGIKQIHFQCKDSLLYIELAEGDEVNTMVVGFAEPLRGTICTNGEEQLVAVSGMWTQDEDATPVLKLEIAFLEQSSTRYMKFFFTSSHHLRMELSERPTKDTLRDGASVVMGSSRLLGMLSGAADSGRLQTRFDALAEPVLQARLISETEMT